MGYCPLFFEYLGIKSQSCKVLLLRWVMLRAHADSIGEDQAVLKNLTCIPTLYDKNSDILSQCIRKHVKGTFVKTLTVLLAFQVHHGDILGGRGHLPAIPDSTSLVNAFGLPHHLASYLQHLTSALSFGTVCLQSSIDL